MDYMLDVLIPKSDLNKLQLSELLIEWGGELYSQDPPKYTNNSMLVFEQFMNIEYYRKYYKSFIGDYLDFDNFMSLKLEDYGSHIYDLELKINNQVKEISSNEVISFLVDLLKLDTFAVFLIRDEECIDEKYKISKEEELVDIIYRSLNWSSPKGVLIIK